MTNINANEVNCLECMILYFYFLSSQNISADIKRPKVKY